MKPKTFDKGITYVKLVIILFAILIIALFILTIIDNTGGDLKTDIGIVIGKHYEEAYTTTTYVNVGYMYMPQSIHRPESYNLTIMLDIGSGSIVVSEAVYHKTHLDDEVQVIYTGGRLTSTIHIKSVEHLQQQPSVNP